MLECFKINGYQWKVIEKLRCQDEKVFNSIKPEWVIVRLVTYVNGIMKCSCCHFEQHGYMCSCIACVLDTLPKYPGPTHHDFAVSHWQVYMYYSTPSTAEEIKKYASIKNAIDMAVADDVKGPSVAGEVVNSVPRYTTVPEKFKISITSIVARNYIIHPTDHLELTPFDKEARLFQGNKHDFEEKLRAFTRSCDIKKSTDAVSSNSYAYLIQPFKELACALDDCSTGYHLAEVKQIMEHQTQKAIERASTLINKEEAPTGSLVPYCIPKDKKRKVFHLRY